MQRTGLLRIRDGEVFPHALICQLRGDKFKGAYVADGSAVIRRAVGELSFDLTGTMFETGRLVRASNSHHAHRQCQLHPNTGRWRRGRVRA